MTAILLSSLERYREVWTTGLFHYASFNRREEQGTLARFTDFVSRHERCFERDYPIGHVTGSVFILNPAMDQVILTLHTKLGKWLQLGGHCDGEQLAHEAARREGHEESGLKTLRFLPYERLVPGDTSAVPLPFDVDVHAIPARKADPEHWHFDVRYLMIADADEPLLISDESKDLRWVPLDTVTRLTQERSMQRPFAKITLLREQLRRLDPLRMPGDGQVDPRIDLGEPKSAES